MTIKTLLMGTAAAFVAVTGAKAADAPVTMVEAEPVEYVRVCDVYGKGFFYIPGTETCLKIGGYLRMRVQANDQEYNTDIDGDTLTPNGTFVGDDYTVGTRTRARLDFDAREETELGTLRGKIRVQATNSPANPNVGSSSAFTMEEGFLQLGGLTVGYLDSVWTADDGGIADGLLLDEYDFAAGDFQANRISYTAAASSFSGTLSVEDDGTGDFIPDVIAKLAYKGKWGGAYVLGVYDEDSGEQANSRLGSFDGQPAVFRLNTDEFDDNNGKDGAFVLKGGLLLQDLLVDKSILKVEGHYAFDPSIYARVGDVGRVSIKDNNDFNQSSFNSFNGGREAFSSQWQVGAAYRQDIGKFFVIANGIYGQTFDLNETRLSPGPVLDLGNVGSIDYWGVGGDIGYKVTSNLTVKAEVSYVDLDLPSRVDDFDQTRGFIEIRRDF